MVTIKRCMRPMSYVFTFACAMFLLPSLEVRAEEEDSIVEEVVVTGSRLKRDQYSSASPLQVLEVDKARQMGISSIAELLQRATVANGAQVDATLNSNAGNSNATEAPPSGGVGSSNINLRGLGPERTLVMVNGRRMGSVGVRGAPAQPDINLIPFAMVERAEVLTEGVSAIYGADAVAGVVNLILRDEFEGLEITSSIENPEGSGGNIRSLSFIAGAVGDRASITFGAESFDRRRISTGDRGFSDSLQYLHELEDGTVLSVDRSPFFDNVIGVNDQPAFWIHYTPGQTDIGIPNFGTNALLPPPPAGIEPRNSATERFPLNDFYNDQDERRRADLVSEIERFSAVATGKVQMDWWANEELYFEAYYLNSQLFSIAATEQVFPDVLGEIPMENGQGGFLQNPDGSLQMFDNPLSPFSGLSSPIVTLEDIPQDRDIERQQFRIVTGLRGDLGESSWSYDVFYSYDRGTGFQSQPILFENNMILSNNTLRFDSDGNLTCGIPSIGYFGFDTQNDCVPTNWYADSIFTGGPNGDGAFSTQAELDYLVGNRTNRTVVEQWIGSAVATGDLIEFSDGRVIAAAIGSEYRKDRIASQNDLVGVQGANAAESPLQEGETSGARNIWEVFGEVSIPLLQDKEYAKDLSLDLAGRYTDESNFGSEFTYRIRLSYSPVEYLSMSGTLGTSYRAPNLREQFLADQGGGEAGSLDPCINNNIQTLLGGTGSQTDAFFQQVVNNCVLSGVAFTDSDNDGNLDATVLGTQGVTTIPVSTGGNVVLEPETSDSITFTVKFAQPWTDAFDFNIAASYWDIQIKDSVASPSASLIINSCYRDSNFPNLTSPFCGLITRPPAGGNPVSAIINGVDASFFNIGEATAKGIDVNTRFIYAFEDAGVDLTWSTAWTIQLEQEVETFSPEDRDENLGEIGTPEVKMTSTLALSWKDWSLFMENRYLGKGKNDIGVNLPVPSFLFAGRPIKTDKDSVGSTWYTDIALTYSKDTWALTAGVNNVADEDPPRIHAFQPSQRNNAVSSTGYDFFGRTFFVTASVSL